MATTTDNETVEETDTTQGGLTEAEIQAAFAEGINSTSSMADEDFGEGIDTESVVDEESAQPLAEETPAQTATEQTAEEKQASRDFVERLRSRNMPLPEDIDDDTLFDILQKGYNDLQRVPSIQEENRRLQQQLAQYQQQLQESQPSSPAQPQDVAPTPKDGRPEYDPRWDRLVEYDAATDSVVVKQEYVGRVPADIATKVERYKRWEQEQTQNLRNNFSDEVRKATGLPEGYDNVQDFVKDVLKKEREEQHRQQEAQQFQQRLDKVNTFIRDKTPAFQRDSNGELSKGPDGKLVYSQYGEALVRQMAFAEKERGITDPIAAYEYATGVLAARRQLPDELYQQLSAQAAPAQQPVPQQQVPQNPAVPQQQVPAPNQQLGGQHMTQQPQVPQQQNTRPFLERAQPLPDEGGAVTRTPGGDPEFEHFTSMKAFSHNIAEQSIKENSL